MTIWVATGNKGKLQEIELLLKRADLELHHQGELSAYTPMPETGTTFEENSMIKVRSLAAVKNTEWVIGEDSGLIVEGLGGLPGVHSARYAGERASDAENNAKLLKMMQIRCPMNRAARFHCCLTVRTPDGEFQTYEGNLEGTIANATKGKEGFGYDPVFIPNQDNPEGKTLAELGTAFKLKHSHRSQAIRAFSESL